MFSYCPKNTNDISYLGNVNVLKRKYVLMRVLKCTEQTKEFKNITCAPDNEIEQKIKYI